MQKTLDYISNEEVTAFKDLVKQGSPDQCWIWQGKVTKCGYGYLYLKRIGQQHGAHRISYLLYKGPLEPKMVIDHECINRLCVNPSHLRQVTRKINNTENCKRFPGNRSVMKIREYQKL